MKFLQRNPLLFCFLCCAFSIYLFSQVNSAVVFDATNLGPENGCECKDYSCGCCAHMESKKIDLNSTVCSNFTYLYEEYGISFTVTWNGYTLYNETVSAKNPPPVCIGAPYLKEWAEVCMRFHDLEASKRRLHGCIEAEAEFKGITVSKYELGCFTIGPESKTETADPVSVVLI